MNIRTHSFKVYQIRNIQSGNTFWTFYQPQGEELNKYGVLRERTLSQLLYMVKDGEKEKNGKSVVKKSDLEFLLGEMVYGGGYEKIASSNK